MTPKDKFVKIYANLPLNLREEIIGVVDGTPITWNVARIEIENNTPNCKVILDNLVKIGILK